MTRLMSVPLPAPEGPEMTMSLEMTAPVESPSAAKHVEQLLALARSQAVHRLGRTDPAPLEQSVRFDSAVLGNRQQEVEHFGRVNTGRRVAEHFDDGELAATEPFFQARALGTDVVRSAKRIHALLLAAFGRLRSGAQSLVHIGHYTHRPFGSNTLSMPLCTHFGVADCSSGRALACFMGTANHGVRGETTLGESQAQPLRQMHG